MGDLEQLGKGALNGIAGLFNHFPISQTRKIVSLVNPALKGKIPNVPLASIDSRYGGAAIVGEQLAQNLVFEAVGALQAAASRVSEVAKATHAAEEGLAMAKQNVAGKPLFDSKKFAKIQANLEGKGVIFDSSPEAIAKLNAANAEAMYLPHTNPGGPGTFLFRPNPSQDAVIHELIHLGQHRARRWSTIFARSPMAKAHLEAAAYSKQLSLKLKLWTAEEKAGILSQFLDYKRKIEQGIF